ncbi:hypothetical protein [Rhizobium laguerreae]|uniref:hypothetical protein n=1 Tax=Rhizobium laguerreae TaxID=1076926 RepID=UPI001C91C119|nr:hypothetical protein [Rhizobium laguerreae]MBY3493866.1 hypothetical protein [Rhizobium laguerreae]
MLKNVFFVIGDFNTLKKISDIAGAMTRLAFLAVIVSFMWTIRNNSPFENWYISQWYELFIGSSIIMVSVIFISLATSLTFYMIDWVAEPHYERIKAGGVSGWFRAVLAAVLVFWALSACVLLVYAVVTQGTHVTN